MHARVMIGAALGLAISAVAVSAQTTDIPDPRADARGRLGPFYFTPVFTVEELGLDTNVFNDDSEKSDFTFTLEPRLNVAVPFGTRALITTSTAADVVYYQAFSSERSLNPEIQARAEVALNRVTLFLAPAYANSRRRPSLEIDARARHQTTDVAAGAEISLSDRFGVETGVSMASVRFDEEAVFDGTSLQDTLNRDARTVWTSIRHDVTPLTTLFLRADASTERFPYSPVRNADSVSLVPSVELKPLALISGGAAVGIRRFQPRTALLPDYTGMVVHANLAYTIQGATRLRFTADRDLAYSYSQTQPYYVIHGYGLGVERHIGGRFDMSGGADWQTYNYKSLVGLEPVEGTPQVTRTRTWSLSVGYRLNQSRRLGFGVTYRQRDSNGDYFAPYSGLRIMSTLDSGL